MTYSILAEGLVKRFGETRALDGVSLAVRTGTVFGLLGPNGAGKTTAVRILATLLTPDAGTASVDGHDVVREPHQVRKLIGLTGQYASVDETLTGTENPPLAPSSPRPATSVISASAGPRHSASAARSVRAACAGSSRSWVRPWAASRSNRAISVASGSSTSW